MSQRATILTISLLCLILALALMASAALAECPRYPPATGYVDGIGYQPLPGSPVCHYTGWRTSNPGAPPVEFRCHPFDPSANPFGGSGSIFDVAAFKIRYGIDRPACPSCNFGIDAETILGAGSVFLQKQCCANIFNTANTHTCFPTFTELFDYGAAHAATTWVQSGIGGSGSGGLLCGNGRKDREETCATCPQDLGPCEGPAPLPPPTPVEPPMPSPAPAPVPTPLPSPLPPGDAPGAPTPCPAGQACLPIVPDCSRCPEPSAPTLAGILAAALECSRWRAVVESAAASAKSPLVRQYRRQLVADCVRAIDREITRTIQP
jgi:hypothetical protein